MSRTEPAAASCPHCAVSMREVSARARSGYLVLLDQCPQCGGVWCDRWELYPLAADEAARIDPVDDTLLRATAAPTGSPGRCPRCTAALQPFRDRALPADARIERCAVCDGMWMNRGELARAKRRTPPTAAPRSETLERLTAAYGATSHWSKVANLDAATYADDGADAHENLDTGALVWSTAPWIVLRALLHLLLRI